MPRYTVELARTATLRQCCTVNVTAADRLEAEEIAFYADGPWELDALLDTHNYRIVSLERAHMEGAE